MKATLLDRKTRGLLSVRLPTGQRPEEEGFITEGEWRDGNTGKKKLGEHQDAPGIIKHLWKK